MLFRKKSIATIIHIYINAFKEVQILKNIGELSGTLKTKHIFEFSCEYEPFSCLS